MRSIQISPTFPPDISGVGDYAWLLSEEFVRAGKPIETLVAGSNAWKGREATSLPGSNLTALAAAIDQADCVLLHFSGYGYARRGLCQWLVNGPTSWKSAKSGRVLITMFHEVAASGPIWRSSFWTSFHQRRIAKHLALLTDRGFVSSEAGMTQLKGLAPSLSLEVLPVFSNIGEPEVVLPLSDREDCGVVFGGVGRRRQVYEQLFVSGAAGTQSLKQLGIVELLDIGPSMDLPAKIGDTIVKSLGPLPAQEVSQILASARVGLVDYPGHLVTKSGIAAAYFAHGMLVVNTSRVGGLAADLRERREFAGLDAFLSGDLSAQLIADAGQAWYQQHSLKAVAKSFLAHLA